MLWLSSCLNVLPTHWSLSRSSTWFNESVCRRRRSWFYYSFDFAIRLCGQTDSGEKMQSIVLPCLTALTRLLCFIVSKVSLMWVGTECWWVMEDVGWESKVWCCSVRKQLRKMIWLVPLCISISCFWSQKGWKSKTEVSWDTKHTRQRKHHTSLSCSVSEHIILLIHGSFLFEICWYWCCYNTTFGAESDITILLF